MVRAHWEARGNTTYKEWGWRKGCHHFQFLLKAGFTIPLGINAFHSNWARTQFNSKN